MLQGAPHCSGADHFFKYSTGVLITARDFMGTGAAIGPRDTIPPNATPGNMVLRGSTCGVNPDSEYAQTYNGGALALHILVQVEANSILSPPDGLEGHLVVELSQIGACIVRPEKPDDLTMTSASGANYWCK
jgi:hypothetical protein